MGSGGARLEIHIRRTADFDSARADFNGAGLRCHSPDFDVGAGQGHREGNDQPSNPDPAQSQ